MVNNTMDFRMEMPGEASAMFQEDTWLNTGSVIAGVVVIALALGLKKGYAAMGNSLGASMDKALEGKAPENNFKFSDIFKEAFANIDTPKAG